MNIFNSIIYRVASKKTKIELLLIEYQNLKSMRNMHNDEALNIFLFIFHTSILYSGSSKYASIHKHSPNSIVSQKYVAPMFESP